MRCPRAAPAPHRPAAAAPLLPSCLQFAIPKTAPYWQKMAANIASGGMAGTVSLAFVYSLDYARTRLANDSKSSKKGGGEREFNGLADVYKKVRAGEAGLVGVWAGAGDECGGRRGKGSPCVPVQ